MSQAAVPLHSLDQTMADLDDVLGQRQGRSDDADLPVQVQARHNRHDIGNLWTGMTYIWARADDLKDRLDRLDGKLDRLLWSVMALLGSIIAGIVVLLFR